MYDGNLQISHHWYQASNKTDMILDTFWIEVVWEEKGFKGLKVMKLKF